MPAELVTGTASELNDLLAAGELQVSVVSAVEYARNAAAYHLLPDLAITCDGPVHSVALFSPPAGRRSSTAAPCCCTASSRTSVLLLELLVPAPLERARRASPPPAPKRRTCDALAGLPHEAVLVIGDAALLLAAEERYPVRVDLGAEWKAWTGLPFVFAVWAARREAELAGGAGGAPSGCSSRAPGGWRISTSSPRQAARATGVAEAVCRAYLGRPGLRALLPPPRRAHRFLPAAGAGRAGAGRVAVVHLGGVSRVIRASEDLACERLSATSYAHRKGLYMS